MKRTIWAIVAGLIVMSCDNENSVNPAPLGAATISGVVLSDLDENDSDKLLLERVPSAPVYAVFVINDNQVTYQAQTNSNGEFSISVPAGYRSAYLDVYVADFNTDINRLEGFTSNGDPIYVRKKASYTRGFQERISVIVARDQSNILNLEISQPVVIE